MAGFSRRVPLFSQPCLLPRFLPSSLFFTLFTFLFLFTLLTPSPSPPPLPYLSSSLPSPPLPSFSSSLSSLLHSSSFPSYLYPYFSPPSSLSFLFLTPPPCIPFLYLPSPLPLFHSLSTHLSPLALSLSCSSSFILCPPFPCPFLSSSSFQFTTFTGQRDIKFKYLSQFKYFSSYLRPGCLVDGCPKRIHVIIQRVSTLKVCTLAA